MAEERELKFVVDSTLGKLAKWLRLLGFDTEFLRRKEPPAPSERILLTRTRAFHKDYSGTSILIASDRFREQIKEVVARLSLELDKTRFFTLCSLCNTPLKPLAREEVEGLVPKYVFQTAEGFRRCPKCGRIYWWGSHGERAREELEKLGIV